MLRRPSLVSFRNVVERLFSGLYGNLESALSGVRRRIISEQRTGSDQRRAKKARVDNDDC